MFVSFLEIFEKYKGGVRIVLLGGSESIGKCVGGYGVGEEVGVVLEVKLFLFY